MPKKIPVNEVLKLSRQGYTDADIIKYLRSEGYSSVEVNDAVNQAKIKQELVKTAGVEGSEFEGMEEAPSPSEEYAEAPVEESEVSEVGEEEIGEGEMQPSIMEQGGEGQEVQEEYAPEAPAPEYQEAEAPAPTEEYAPAPQEYAQQYPYSYGTAAASTSNEAVQELAEEIINEKWEEFKTKIGDMTELKRYIGSKLKQVEDRVKRVELNFDKVQLGIMGQVKQYGSRIDSLDAEVQALQSAFSQILQPLVSSVKELRDVSDEIKTKKTRTPATKAKVEKLKKIVAKAEGISRRKKK